jgi:uncharacterized protein (DUF1778 family)
MADALKKSETTPSKLRRAGTPRRPSAERERLNFRLDARIKQRAEDAAALLGQDLSTFAESALDEKAQAVIERAERLVLSERDFARFVDSLNDPKPAGARLKAAAEEYKAQSRQHPEANL